MELGIEYAKKNNADLLLATDPDCDRVGIAVKNTQGEYVLLSGNETGMLLLDYICSRRTQMKTMPEDPVTVKTIVTIDMAERIAAKYGVKTINVLTGFKFIGEQIGFLEKQGTENIWNNIIMDFRQPISYLFPAIIITMAGVLVFKIYKKGKGRIRFSCILFIIYIEILMQTAFFSREPGSRQQIDLNLFGTWGQTAIAHAYFIENIIMFIPFGLLAPMVFERMRKVRFCVFIGFLCSCGIELSQLITQRGYCQLDDVVTNTVGMLVGWGIWKMLSSVGMAENPLF